MTQNAPYLESKVMTAPSHRLHLMLIEGAIRFGRQAEEALNSGDQAAASQSLLRVLDIVGELIAGVRTGTSKLNQTISQFYLFLFGRVSQAKVNGDIDKLKEALQFLEYERETWQLVCEKLMAQPATAVPTKSDDVRQTRRADVRLSLEA